MSLSVLARGCSTMIGLWGKELHLTNAFSRFARRARDQMGALALGGTEKGKLI